MSMQLRNSLQLRLLIGSLFGVIFAVLIAGVFIGSLYRVHATQSFESELDHHLDELIALLTVDEEGVPKVRHLLSDPQFNVEQSGLYWQVDAPRRWIGSTSLSGGLKLATGADNRWQAGMAADEPVWQRSVRVRVDRMPLTVTIASAQHLLRRQVDDFRSDLMLSMVVVGALLLGGAILLVRFGLAPVRRLSEEVDRLRNGEIQRLNPEVPGEFATVVNRFNALLDGQAQLIARARTESGNLAHNLRTPLALITDEAEQLMRSKRVESAKFLLSHAEAMQLQIDYHLARAAAAGTRGAGTLTQVEPLLAQILAAMHRLHAGRGIAAETQVAPGLRLPCDRGDLAEILFNLIDNGFKWAASKVIICCSPGRIEIGDDGPGIPEEQRGDALQLGVRLDPKTPGTGLGLAATVDLLRFYDAELTLGRADLGGLSAVVAFRKGLKQAT